MSKNQISNSIIKDIENKEVSGLINEKSEEVAAIINIRDEIDHSFETLPECELLKYPNKVLRIFGLFHRRGDKPILKAYTISVCLISLVNFIRFLLSYEVIYGRSEPVIAILVLKVTCTLWFFIAFLSSIIMFINNERHEREQAFLNSAYQVIEMSHEYCRQKKLRLTVYIIYSIMVSLVLFGISFFTVALLGPKFLFVGVQLFLSPFHASEWAINSVAYKLLIAFICVVSTAHILLSNAVYLSHSAITIELIRKFNLDFVDLVKKNVLVSNESLIGLHKSIPTNRKKSVIIGIKSKICFGEDRFDEFRIRYLKLSYIVERLDLCYRELIAITVVLYTIALLMLLYIVSDWTGNCVNGILQILYPYWIFLLSIMLLLIIVFPAKIHSLGNEAIKHLFRLEIKEFSHTLAFKVNLMIGTLSNSKMSLTSWGLLDITKDFILTVVGTIITYFIVVLEFKERHELMSTTTNSSCI